MYIEHALTLLDRLGSGEKQIRCCAAPCSEAHGPFDHFEIQISILRFELARISKRSNGPRDALQGAAQQRI
jgi:hypothetical protein